MVKPVRNGNATATRGTRGHPPVLAIRLSHCPERHRNGNQRPDHRIINPYVQTGPERRRAHAPKRIGGSKGGSEGGLNFSFLDIQSVTF